MIFITLFLTFLKIGAFTFGGGYAMIPLIQEQVNAYGWMTEQELINFIAVSESTPGPFAVNISTYVGMTTASVLGALVSTFGVVLPSFIIILLVARCYHKFCSSTIVKGMMSGLRPAVVGLIAVSGVSIGRSVFFPKEVSTSSMVEPEFFISAAIFITMLILIRKKIHPIKIILLSAVIGVIVGQIGLLV